MRKLTISLAILGASLAVAPLAAVEPAAQSSTQSTEATKPAKAPKICRTKEAITGSRMKPRRTCRTAAEWATADQKDTESLSSAAAGGQIN